LAGRFDLLSVNKDLGLQMLMKTPACLIQTGQRANRQTGLPVI